MIVHTDVVEVTTKTEFDFVDVTEALKEIVVKSKVHNGIVNVFLPGATGAIILNQKEENLIKEYRAAIEATVKDDLKDAHFGNAKSHARAFFLNQSLTIPIREKKIDIGVWQSIMLLELDTRPRTRRLSVTIIGSIKLQEEF